MSIAINTNNKNDNLWRLALIIAAFLLLWLAFSSCGRNYCQRKYPPKDSTSFIQTANIDTLYIPMPADTVTIESQINCPDQTIIYKDGKTQYKVLIKDKVLTVYRITKLDSLRLIYSYKNTQEFKKLTEIKYNNVISYKYPKLFWYSLGLNIIILLFITRKFWLKLIKQYILRIP